MNNKVYEIFITNGFEKEFSKLGKGEQERIRKAIIGLKSNPYTGKPLGHDFFREKKIKGKRLYFIIYEEFTVIFIINFGGKKTQQGTINRIKQKLPEYRKELEYAIKNFRRTF
jgi:mRNA-degrading endonuclease RelE of RelBE toxin-antitoxin system